MRILLLYAHPEEVRYIDFEPKMMISEINWNKINYDNVILFGSCGLLRKYYPPDPYDDSFWWEEDNRIPLDRLMVPYKWWQNKKHIYVTTQIIKLSFTGEGYTAESSLHQKNRVGIIRHDYPNVFVIDTESYFIGKRCKDLDIKFVSVRYIIDRCDQRAAPWGVNHFWRMYQHRRMQEKFQEILNELGD